MRDQRCDAVLFDSGTFCGYKAAFMTAVRNQRGLTQCFHPACKEVELVS